jgi:hypothetical protein
MNTCPCCSEQLLRHARHNGVYWFCPRCWQEMPNFSAALGSDRQSSKSPARLKRDLDLVY